LFASSSSATVQWTQVDKLVQERRASKHLCPFDFEPTTSDERVWINRAWDEVK
jgi:hypothetical protein